MLKPKKIMIKASELRIGNYLLNQHNELHEVGFNCLQRFRYPTMGGDEITLKPIPLTEEWLVKFGCIEQRISSTKKNYWNKEKDFSVDVEFTLDGLLFYYLLSGTDRRKHIIYVHKLQNIHFELKDEELKLKQDASN